MRRSGATDLISPSTVTRSRRGVAVAQQRLEERVLGLGEQVGERVGIGGVAGLGALGLGHAELVEEHLLQLLGLPRLTSLAADGVVGVLLGLAHLGGEVGLELGQRRLVDGDAGALHARQDLDERQLEVAQQLGAAGLVEPLVEHGRELEHRAGPHHRVAGRGVVVGREVEHPLVAGGLLGLELAARWRTTRSSRSIGALVGAHEVGRQRGVAGDAGQRSARGWPAPGAAPWRRAAPWGRSGSASQAASAASCSRVSVVRSR